MRSLFPPARPLKQPRIRGRTMVAFRIFYAWQSDRLANLCRSLIRTVLDAASNQLKDSLAIEDAPRRVEVEIDQDTQGEPGSPSVAATIFCKIKKSDAYVADLTFTSCRESESGAPVPNPNVLLEYGYALRSLGEQRIIAVFNEEFGKCDDLPFDLRHKRRPIMYRTSAAESDEQAQAARRDLRQRLAKELAGAIQDIVQNAPPKPGDSSAVDTRPLVGEFPLESGVLQGSSDVKHPFPSGLKILLSLRSRHGELSLTNYEAQRVAIKSLEPLGLRCTRRASSAGAARVLTGAARVVYPRPDETAVQNVSILLRDGSLLGIDCKHVGRCKHAPFPHSFVSAGQLEKILMGGLSHFLELVGKQLNLDLPLDVGVALEGARNHYLAVDRSVSFDQFLGPLLDDRIEDRFRIDHCGVDPAEVLTPFFKKVCDEAWAGAALTALQAARERVFGQEVA